MYMYILRYVVVSAIFLCHPCPISHNMVYIPKLSYHLSCLFSFLDRCCAFPLTITFCCQGWYSFDNICILGSSFTARYILSNLLAFAHQELTKEDEIAKGRVSKFESEIASTGVSTKVELMSISGFRPATLLYKSSRASSIGDCQWRSGHGGSAHRSDRSCTQPCS